MTMGQQYIPEGTPAGFNPQNVVETYPVYDTLLVGPFMADQHLGHKYVPLKWYESFAALALEEEWPFLDVRNISDVGLAYTNVESKDSFPWAFKAITIGVQFFTAYGAFPDIQAEPPFQAGDYGACQIWQVNLWEHVGLVFEVRDDQKLKTTVELTPSGTGPYGQSILGGTILGGGSTVGGTSCIGEPVLANRWRFPDWIDIPRGCKARILLKPSTYARYLLACMNGPYSWPMKSKDPQATEPILVDALVGVRVSLFGKREVQQRGELHY